LLHHKNICFSMYLMCGMDGWAFGWNIFYA
jgi:hypothetical protein